MIIVNNVHKNIIIVFHVMIIINYILIYNKMYLDVNRNRLFKHKI